jgi:phosphate:Na+ symporter
MEVFKIIYTVLGGLGIFFYGMKSMSEALQSVAGGVIKNIIHTLTTNRLSAVAVGTVVTMLVQSSSVSTVMVVGFVNAGLMELAQAIGVIFGANIGTTITGWIISIKVGKYGLLFIGLGIFPLLFGKTNKWRQLGRVLFGIGMIFFGLKLMGDAFKPLRTMPEFLEAISYFSGQHYGSYFASIIIGCLLTVIIQSSSAMLGITIALATTGVIQFHTAAALVMGENIGTTITALLASIGGNVNAKRAARAHAIFNMLGVFVIFSIFPIYINFIDWLIPGNPFALNANGEYENIAVHIATGHSIFNVTATLVFLPFLKNLANLVTRITPDKSVKEQHHLVMLGEPHNMIPATALAQAKEEANKMKDVVDRMYKLTREIFEEKVDNKQEAIKKIHNYESITDNIQKEITVFLVKLLENPMSSEESKEAYRIIRIADELESIGDYLEKLCIYSKKIELKDLLDKEAGDDFFLFFNDVEEFYQNIAQQIVNNEEVDFSIIERRSEELKREANLIRQRHNERVGKGDYPALTALTYSDVIVSLRKIRSHTENFAQAYSTLSV